MISNSVIMSLVICFIICFILPILTIVILQIKYKNCLKPFFMGALAFFIYKFLIRTPILYALFSNYRWYNMLQYDYTNLSYVLLTITEVLLEEIATFIFIKFTFKKHQRYVDSLSFGIGHGGIEVALLTGISMLTMLIYCIAINNGTFNNILSKMDANLIDQIFIQCTNLSANNIILTALNRIFDIFIHIGLAMIIYVGFRINKPVIYLFIAVLVHTIKNIIFGLLQSVFSFSILQSEIVIFIIAILSIVYSFMVKKRKILDNVEA